MIPRLRTSRRFAAALAAIAVAAIGLALLAAGRVEDALSSATAAAALLIVWCAAGAGAAVAAIVDAYTEPEGEDLELAVEVATTVFAVLGLAVIGFAVAGSADFS